MEAVEMETEMVMVMETENRSVVETLEPVDLLMLRRCTRDRPLFKMRKKVQNVAPIGKRKRAVRYLVPTCRKSLASDRGGGECLYYL